MSEDLMRYDLLAQHALRGVVRLALNRVERDGLPGEHHFFIAFNTRQEGVRMSDRLLGKYRDEMTIVIQHQFWNLRTYDDHFEIELSFDNIPEQLSVPYDAIKGFYDPSVQFGLQFETIGDDSEEAATEDTPAETEETVIETGAANQTKKKSKPRRKKKTAETETSTTDASNDDSKVVSLDAFRKK